MPVSQPTTKEHLRQEMTTFTVDDILLLEAVQIITLFNIFLKGLGVTSSYVRYNNATYIVYYIYIQEEKKQIVLSEDA